MGNSRPAPAGYSRLTFNLEKTLHKELRKAAIDDEKSVTDILVEMIRQYVDQHRSPRRKKE